MKTLFVIIILALASLCLAKDSVSVNVASSTGILTTKILYYDADKLLQAWQYSPTTGVINPVIPAEMQQYIVRDTAQKNMPPFMGGNLMITRKDLGKDTVALDAVNTAIIKLVKKKVVVK
jgi:hypothetical protein